MILFSDIDGEIVEEIRTRNIIDMAMGFSAMTRVFESGSADTIKEELWQTALAITAVESKQDFIKLHHSFCQWFIENIRTSGRIKGGNNIKSPALASYGHGAKVLDVVLKVLVDYCSFPDQETAKKLKPWLNSAVDTKMMKYLKERPYKEASDIFAMTIEQVDEDTYNRLQYLVRRDIEDTFKSLILPVDWDDILWRYLNRKTIVSKNQDDV